MTQPTHPSVTTTRTGSPVATPGMALPETEPPAAAHARIVIDAPRERVWNLIADVRAWPQWNAAVSSVQMDGELLTGTSFRWRSKGLTVVSTVHEIVSLQRLSWHGAAFGTRAYHSWDLAESADGVVVETYERFDGWLPRLLPGMMQKTLDDTLPAWLRTLKDVAEQGGR